MEKKNEVKEWVNLGWTARYEMGFCPACKRKVWLCKAGSNVWVHHTCARENKKGV